MKIKIIGTILIALIFSAQCAYPQENECPCNQGSSDPIPPTTGLPMNILRFDVALSNTNAQLNWQTNSDADFRYFEVERSLDGDTWKKAGTVKTNGTDATINNYRFTDSNITGLGVNVVFYRLHLWYFNDVVAYSMIRTLNIGNAKGMVSVWYNNASNKLQVTIPLVSSETNAELALISSDGKILLRKTVTLAKGYNEASLNLPNGLPAGMYLLQVEKDKVRSTVKFVKQ